MADHPTITKRQHEILGFIRDKIENRGFPPSIREIGEAFEIVSPNGEIIKRASFFDEDLLFVDIDPNAILHAREHSRHMLDENLLLTQQMLAETITLSRND